MRWRKRTNIINWSHPVEGSGGCRGVDGRHGTSNASKSVVGHLLRHNLVVFMRTFKVHAGKGIHVRILLGVHFLHFLYCQSLLFILFICIEVLRTYLLLRSQVLKLSPMFFNSHPLLQSPPQFHLLFLFFDLCSVILLLPRLYILYLLLELLKNPMAELLLAFLLALPLLVDEGVVAVLDHMFCASLFEDWHQFAPAFPILQHEFEDLHVFVRSPESSLLLVVEVIEPTFAAMFGRFEDGAVGVIEEVLSNIVPSIALLLLDCLNKPFVFLPGPSNFSAWLDHAEELEVQKVGIFVEESGREAIPLFTGLNR